MYQSIKNLTLPVMLTTSLIFSTTVFADDDDHHTYQQQEPYTLLINFQVASSGVGMTPDGSTQYYIVGGPGYAPERIFRNGEVSDRIDQDRQVATLEGAQITFEGKASDPIVKFTCLAGSCKMKLKDGGVLVSNAGVPLEGRAINMWGPVFKAPTFSTTDGTTGVFPIRILGCGGLKEVAGKGRFAGMVGSVCFNGILNFDTTDQTKLTGSSKCTITMHTPIDPSIIP